MLHAEIEYPFVIETQHSCLIIPLISYIALLLVVLRLAAHQRVERSVGTPSGNLSELHSFPRLTGVPEGVSYDPMFSSL